MFDFLTLSGSTNFTDSVVGYAWNLVVVVGVAWCGGRDLCWWAWPVVMGVA